MNLGILNPLEFVIGTILIILLPGPNSLYVFSVASSRGVLPAYQGALGIVVGDTILMLLTARGVAVIVRAYPFVFSVLQGLGAAYLAYLGMLMLRAASEHFRHSKMTARNQKMTARNPQTIDMERVSSANASPHHKQSPPFQTALIISLLNPKAILFFVSFFIQFVDKNYPYPALSFLILGAIVQLCSIIYLSSLILAGKRLADWAAHSALLKISGLMLTGIIFIAFGARLAASGI